MPGARPLESDPQQAADRGAHHRAPRSTPLTVVSAAVAGDDLPGIAAGASAALGRPVVISLPALGPPVLWPPAAVSTGAVADAVGDAAAMLAGGAPARTGQLTVPIRIAQADVGVVIVLGAGRLREQEQAWLEATVAAAAVASLLHDSRPPGREASTQMVLRTLAAGSPSDLEAALEQAGRLGVELHRGGVALCVQALGELPPSALRPVAPALVAAVGRGRVLALVSGAGGGDGVEAADQLSDHWRELGLEVARSSPRRASADLHEALREAEVLLELTLQTGGELAGQEQTYRLLIGVLLRNPDELRSLRADTIAPLAAYDAEHETALVCTLQGFLAHHGSTTETAEAMKLHRHTVGYRLARVHEVSGLSPYASAGRERLSLGLKAHQILEADRARSERS